MIRAMVRCFPGILGTVGVNGLGGDTALCDELIVVPCGQLGWLG
jgi:hypothetical protein